MGILVGRSKSVFLAGAVLVLLGLVACAKPAELESQQAQIAELEQRNDDLEARLAAEEQKLGLSEASSASLSFGAPMIWIIGAGLGLLIGSPGLVLWYRRFRESNDELR